MPVRSSYLHRPSCYVTLNPAHALMEMWTHIISPHNKTIGLRSPGSLMHQTHLRTRSTSSRCLRGIMYCRFFLPLSPFQQMPQSARHENNEPPRPPPDTCPLNAFRLRTFTAPAQHCLNRRPIPFPLWNDDEKSVRNG